MSIQHFQTKLGITKYSIVTNSNDSVTLRLMTEHDLAMLYEWLNRSHIVEWWGGEEARPTLADVQEQYLPSVLAQESVTPYIAMLNGEPIGYAQSYVALGSEDGWWEEETDPGVRGMTSHWRMHHNWAKAWEPSWFELWLSCCSMIRVTKIQTDPSPSNLRAIRCYEKAGFEQGTVTTPDGPAVYMVQTRQAFERTRSVANPSIEGDVQGLAPLAAPHVGVKHHEEAVIAEVSTQLSEVVGVIERHLQTDVAGRTFVRLRSQMAA